MTYCYRKLYLSTQYMKIIFIILGMLLMSQNLLADISSEENKKVQASQFTKVVADYKLPEVNVVRQDGKKLSFLKELHAGRPVILNFVFISCSAICPMLSHILSKVETQLTKDGQKFHLITISIDPENDTPSALTVYAKKFDAGVNWDFYTSTREASLTIQKAFKAFRGDKMNHASLIFLRPFAGKSWVRLEGFMSPDDVVAEYNAMLKTQ